SAAIRLRLASPLSPYTTLFRSDGSVPAARSLQIFTLLGLAANCEIHVVSIAASQESADRCAQHAGAYLGLYNIAFKSHAIVSNRSEEHTSELQSRENLVCRLLL